MLSKSLRMDIMRPLLFIAFWSIPISELAADEPGVGILAESSATSSFMVSVENLSSTSPYFLMVSSNSAPWNFASAGTVEIVSVTSARQRSLSNELISSEVFTLPLR